VCGLSVVAALGWAGWQAVRPRPQEPIYDGKALGYWIAPAGPWEVPLTSPLPPTLLRDSNAVPFLIAVLNRPDSSFEPAYCALYEEMPFAVRGKLPVPYRHARMRLNALRLLNRMEVVGKPAVPAIERLTKDEMIPVIRLEAVEVLGKLGRGDDAVTAALNEALRDKDLGVRSIATNALWQLDPEAAAKAGVSMETIIGSLIETNNSYRSRLLAAKTLANIGQGDNRVVAAFAAALNDRDLSVRQAATNALLKIDPEAAARAGARRESP
jgi:HEAT repeat protein